MEVTTCRKLSSFFPELVSRYISQIRVADVHIPTNILVRHIDVMRTGLQPHLSTMNRRGPVSGAARLLVRRVQETCELSARAFLT